MKKNVWLALAGAAAFAGSTALAQTQSNTQGQARAGQSGTHASGQTTSTQSTSAQPGEMQTLTGTVKSYKAGKKLVITGADGKSQSLPLDQSARVDGTPKPGDPVTVMWMTDSKGRQRVTSISSGSAGATGTGSTGASGMSGTTGTTGTTSGYTGSTTSGDAGGPGGTTLTPGAGATGGSYGTPRTTPPAGATTQPTPVP